MSLQTPFRSPSQIASVGSWLAVMIVLACSAPLSAETETARPNIVWILSEDSSKHYFKHFDLSGVSTPAIEAMAAHGVTFDRAFSNSPVCSVARSTLITGCYAPRIGTHYHRPLQPVALPTGLELLPVYLRDVGYYTTNNNKTDYNVALGEPPWDESGKQASWKHRADPETPFFHVQTHTQSHESSLHFSTEAMETPTEFSQADVRVPPYLPDTELTRFTAAFYRDRISVIDQLVGRTIADLQEAGQLENTFVFYFGDHGGALPRSKGYVFETGVHVPLVVRIPENYRSLIDRDLGSRTKGFVSFVDFAPTVLRLAGVAAPEAMDGHAFLGEGVPAESVDTRDTTFSHADRMDEKYDLVRAVRVGDWKYIRYFEAQYPNGLENEYRYNMLAYQQWRELATQQTVAPEQQAFFQPRPVEALFDLSKDPDEINNLAVPGAHGNRLLEMRRTLMQHLKATHDLGFVPEAVFLRQGRDNPAQFGEEHATQIAEYIDTANIALLPWEQAIGELISAMNSGDPWERYWAFVAASSMTASAPDTRVAAQADESLLKLAARQTLDPEPLVAARATELLAILGKTDPREALVRSVSRSRDPAEALQILNIAASLHAAGQSDYPMDAEAFQFRFPVAPKSEIRRRLKHFAN